MTVANDQQPTFCSCCSTTLEGGSWLIELNCEAVVVLCNVCVDDSDPSVDRINLVARYVP